MSARSKRQSPIPRTVTKFPPLPFPGAGVVRLARVAEARRRIASGWYDRAEVRGRLVDAVLQEIRGR